ncbi:MAG: hypothetical protein GDA56_03415 [Hormoscilla sp. GM7CHS1pb]|nr:hypothetical protein [Hormoscilla sp. GM7CHS1pb]
MPSDSDEKIDLNVEYPCPCRRRGRLSNIILTEALGCNKCQQIFVVQEGATVMEQLSTNYPYKKTWCWTGREWQKVHSDWSEHYWSVILLTFLVLLVVCLLWIFLFADVYLRLWAMAPLLVVLLLVMMQWLTYRR